MGAAWIRTKGEIDKLKLEWEREAKREEAQRVSDARAGREERARVLRRSARALIDALNLPPSAAGKPRDVRDARASLRDAVAAVQADDPFRQDAAALEAASGTDDAVALEDALARLNAASG